MKNILIIQRGDSDHNMLNTWGKLFGAEFEKKGIHAHFFSAEGETERCLRQLSDAAEAISFDAALAFNADGLQMLETDGENLWDKLRIPFFDYLVDHPLEHTFLDCPCKNYHVICVDKNHAAFVRRYYPRVKIVNFLPLAGFGDVKFSPDSFETFTSREYGIAITAGLVRPELFLDRILSLPEKGKAIALLWTDYMESHLDMAPEDALHCVLDDYWHGYEISDETYLKIADLTADAIMYMRSYIRQRAVEGLMVSGIPFHIWGNGWGELRARYKDSGAVFHEDVSITETAAIYRKTKLALSILPMFKQGTHDRIATAQINGAAVITDENDYLKKLYAGTNGIYYYCLEEIDRLPKRLEALLSDEKALYQTALGGQVLARSEFTGEAIGGRLLEIIQAALDKE